MENVTATDAGIKKCRPGCRLVFLITQIYFRETERDEII